MSLAHEVRALVEKNPGITQPKLLEITGASKAAVNRSLSSLRKDGVLTSSFDKRLRMHKYYCSQDRDVIRHAREIGGHFGILIAQMQGLSAN